MSKISLFLTLFITSVSCTTTKPMVVDTTSVEAGSEVKAGGKNVKLVSDGKSMKTGDPISYYLKDLDSETKVAGRVAVINVVPSVDTPVCDEQTHILGESPKLNTKVARLTISRDLPMAQSRFAKEAKLQSIEYLSDYKKASFGKNSGLLMEGNELLARAVIVVDKEGIIRYLQIVPDVSHLPDMDKAFTVANGLMEETTTNTKN